MDVKVLLLALDDKFSGLMSKLEDRISKVKAMKGDTGPAGVAGPKGDVGPKGDTGPEGKPGKDGKDGKDGEDGAEGKEGVGVEDASVDFDGHLVLTLTNGEEVDAGSVKDLNEAQAPNVWLVVLTLRTPLLRLFLLLTPQLVLRYLRLLKVSLST